MLEGLRFSEINEVREVHFKSKREKEYEEKLIALLDMPLFMDIRADIAALEEEYKDVVCKEMKPDDGVSFVSTNTVRAIAHANDIDTTELDKPLFRSPMIPR